MTSDDELTLFPIDASHVDSFHRALDIVAREKKYLTLLEAPPLEETREFVLGMSEKKNPQIVALVGDEVVGWCDIPWAWSRFPPAGKNACGSAQGGLRARRA
jgi:hypothetical protein